MVKKLICLILCFYTLTAFASSETSPVITPNANPQTKDGIGVFSSIEFLWWKASPDSLRFATSGVRVQSGSSITSSGKTYSINPSFQPGFRVAFGFYPGHDGWDISAKYTWYHSDNEQNASDANGNMLPFTLSTAGAFTVNGVTSAKSAWDLHYNVLDLELGREFFLSKFLALRIFASLKGAWINQDWDTKYHSNEITFNSGGTLPGEIKSNQDQDSWGVGIRMGLNGTWTLFKGFSIVSDASFSSVWTDYNVSRKDAVTQNGLASISTANVRSSPNTAIINVDLLLGLKGAWHLQNDRYYLTAQVGWENQLWINYGHFLFLSGSSNGDLSLFGLSAKIGFEF